MYISDNLAHFLIYRRGKAVALKKQVQIGMKLIRSIAGVIIYRSKEDV